ncbi:hypothetical protein EDB85DRAFT_1885723 [Lactarius pseudohatsudake]|nr:hypothetical protein EDB85DRAFT_1885723 [Lactarius pseudohatsudake]
MPPSSGTQIGTFCFFVSSGLGDQRRVLIMQSCGQGLGWCMTAPSPRRSLGHVLKTMLHVMTQDEGEAFMSLPHKFKWPSARLERRVRTSVHRPDILAAFLHTNSDSYTISSTTTSPQVSGSKSCTLFLHPPLMGNLNVPLRLPWREFTVLCIPFQVGCPWIAAPYLFLRRRPLTTLGHPPPTAVVESQWSEPCSDAFGTGARVAWLISLWLVLLPIVSVGEEEDGAGQQWQACPLLSPGCGAILDILSLSVVVVELPPPTVLVSGLEVPGALLHTSSSTVAL